MESSKVTARHIKQVASDPQGAQINLMRHHYTDHPASKHKKRKPYVKPRPPMLPIEIIICLKYIRVTIDIWVL